MKCATWGTVVPTRRVRDLAGWFQWDRLGCHRSQSWLTSLKRNHLRRHPHPPLRHRHLNWKTRRTMPTLSSKSIPSIVAKIKVEPLSKRAAPVVSNIVTTFGERAVSQIDNDSTFRINRRVGDFIRSQKGLLIDV